MDQWCSTLPTGTIGRPKARRKKKLQLKEVKKMAKDAGSFIMKQQKVVVVNGKETAVTSIYLTIVASQGNNCRVEKIK